MSIPVKTHKKTYSYFVNIYSNIINEIANFHTSILFPIMNTIKTSQYCKTRINYNLILNNYNVSQEIYRIMYFARNLFKIFKKRLIINGKII